MKNFDNALIWSIPLSLLLMSFTWWMNYVDGASRLGVWRKPLVDLKLRVRKARTKIYLFASVWKMVLIFAFTLLFVTFQLKISVNDLFSLAPRKE